MWTIGGSINLKRTVRSSELTGLHTANRLTADSPRVHPPTRRRTKRAVSVSPKPEDQERPGRKREDENRGQQDRPEFSAHGQGYLRKDMYLSVYNGFGTFSHAGWSPLAQRRPSAIEVRHGWFRWLQADQFISQRCSSPYRPIGNSDDRSRRRRLLLATRVCGRLAAAGRVTAHVAVAPRWVGPREFSRYLRPRVLGGHPQPWSERDR